MAAYPDSPGAQGPGPHEIHSEVIDALHRAIMRHPRSEAKSIYGSALAKLLAYQAKTRAAYQTAHGTGGGPPAEGAGAPGQQPGQVIQSLTGGVDGGPLYYGDQPALPPIVQALGGFPHVPRQFGPPLPPESGLLGAILAAGQQRHPFQRWAA